MATADAGTSSESWTSRIRRALVGSVVTPDAVSAAARAQQSARDGLTELGAPLQAAVDEFHAQEDRAQTALTWITVGGIVLLVVVGIAILAWFFAPVRALFSAVV